MNLFCFGLGYSALHLARVHRDRFSRLSGTVRSDEKREKLAREGIEAFRFDGEAAEPGIEAALDEADLVLHSIAPGEAGDPVLRHFGEALAAAPKLRWIGYLSTIGVYGDRDGAWVDEDTPTDPQNLRSLARQKAERDWLAFGAANRKPAQIFRLAGIYGPGRNPLRQLREGTARRIVKPGQVFNRIHVEDISRALLAGIAHPEAGPVFNLADDEPSSNDRVVAHAAALLGVEPPPEIPFAEAGLSPMAASFWGEVKRVANRRAKRELGWTPLYPTYREGLSALHAAGDGGGTSTAA